MNSATASGDYTAATALGFKKFGHVFKEGKANGNIYYYASTSATNYTSVSGGKSIDCSSSKNCVISCSCNEANEWYDSTSKTGANYISVSTNRSYAFTSSSSSASTANAKKTCYHAASKCPDGYYYYKTAPNLDRKYYIYSQHSSKSNCYKVSCGGDITYPDPTGGYSSVTHISVEDADPEVSDGGLIKNIDKIAEGYGIKCYYPKWPTHIVYEIKRTRTGSSGVYTDSFSTVKVKAYRGTEDVSDRFAMIVDHQNFGEVATGYDCTKAIDISYFEKTKASSYGNVVTNKEGPVALTLGTQDGSSCAFGNTANPLNIKFTIDQKTYPYHISDGISGGITSAPKQPLMYYRDYQYKEYKNTSDTLYHEYSIGPSIHAPVAFIDTKSTSTQVFNTSKPLVQNALKQSGGPDASWGSSSGTGVKNKVIHVLPKVNTTVTDGKYFTLSGPGTQAIAYLTKSGASFSVSSEVDQPLPVGTYTLKVMSSNCAFGAFEITDEKGYGDCYSSTAFIKELYGTCKEANICSDQVPEGGMCMYNVSYKFEEGKTYNIDLIDVECN